MTAGEIPEPRKREGLAGHLAAARMFAADFETGRLHHAWILAGPRGIGKATLAFRFARYLLAGPSGFPAAGGGGRSALPCTRQPGFPPRGVGRPCRFAGGRTRRRARRDTGGCNSRCASFPAPHTRRIGVARVDRGRGGLDEPERTERSPQSSGGTAAQRVDSAGCPPAVAASRDGSFALPHVAAGAAGPAGHSTRCFARPHPDLDAGGIRRACSRFPAAAPARRWSWSSSAGAGSQEAVDALLDSLPEIDRQALDKGCRRGDGEPRCRAFPGIRAHSLRGRLGRTPAGRSVPTLPGWMQRPLCPACWSAARRFRSTAGRWCLRYSAGLPEWPPAEGRAPLLDSPNYKWDNPAVFRDPDVRPS